MLELGLRLDTRAPLRLLDPQALLALAVLDRLARPSFRVLGSAPAPFLFLAGSPFGLLLGADPILFGLLLRGVLFLDSLLLDLAELAEGEENRAFFLLSHRQNLVRSGTRDAPRRRRILHEINFLSRWR